MAPSSAMFGWFPEIVKRLLARRQRYVELDESDSESLETSSLSTPSRSPQNSLVAFVTTHSLTTWRIKPEERRHLGLGKVSSSTHSPSLWGRLRSALRVEKTQQSDESTSRIGIAESPRQYHVSSKEKRTPKRRTYHVRGGKTMYPPRVHFKRKLNRLITISEDEVFEEGLHEC
ncbi:hypothetical protein HJC23_000107 [Cyclotella cryptica]|uniref:Uncharacterized protein n=1 Tax=Cyclotella cryptica TaxID=29204 RepID=A0ABD3NH74_9STRA|eukprot:CCRYP_020936-RA/>CCRYP_020936-RA protein AED:0.14 eAED:0.14 QI:0/-1/0/1/-1/1/1/0/173